jgi:hypothetical protein
MAKVGINTRHSCVGLTLPPWSVIQILRFYVLQKTEKHFRQGHFEPFLASGGRPREYASRLCALNSFHAASLVRDDFDFAINAVDDVEGTLEYLAFILGNGAVFTLRQYDAGKRAN